MPKPVTPLLTVDIIIELVDRPGNAIVLIERKFPPLGWALPGGFVDLGERLEAAAVREAKEETNLDVTLKQLLGCYSDPGRDERAHTVSAVYIGEASGEPTALDDAKNVAVFASEDLPILAFDHALIMDDYRRYLATGETAPIRL